MCILSVFQASENLTHYSLSSWVPTTMPFIFTSGSRGSGMGGKFASSGMSSNSRSLWIYNTIDTNKHYQQMFYWDYMRCKTHYLPGAVATELGDFFHKFDNVTDELVLLAQHVSAYLTLPASLWVEVKHTILCSSSNGQAHRSYIFWPKCFANSG